MKLLCRISHNLQKNALEVKLVLKSSAQFPFETFSALKKFRKLG